MFDVLIIGGGAAGMSCALVLGSAYTKDFAKDKRIGIVMHQKTSHLQSALFNNVLGFTPGTTGDEILANGKQQLTSQYPHIEHLELEKVTALIKSDFGYTVSTNKSDYQAKCVVVAVGYTHSMRIKGLEDYIEVHPRTKPEKDRIYLKNVDHKIEENLYVAGTLAGWRSQFAIASGSGAHVATDILTLWNNGIHTKVHDKVKN